MPMDDLYKALGMFQQGVQQYAISSGVADATKAIDDLNKQNLDFFAKRNAQQQIAQQAAMQLMGAGANASQVQSAMAALAPQQIKDSNDLYAQALQTGNQDLAKTATNLQNFENARADKQMAMQERMGDKQIAAQKEMKRWEIAMDQMKLLASNKQQQQPKTGEVSFDTNIKMAHNLLTKLENAVDNSGTWESGLPLISNKEDAAVLDAVPYQLAITYAKIVDPESVAREGEVAAAQKYLIPMGMMANKEKVMAHISHMRDTINEYQQARRGVVPSPGQQQQQSAQSPGGLDARTMKVIEIAQKNPTDPLAQQILKKYKGRY